MNRDYSYRASTLISVYEDCIEFVSVGGLPTEISLDDILLGLSVCCNPKLAEVFYRLKLIEAYGTGLPKTMKAYERSDLKPKLEVTSNAFKITLPNRNAAAKDADTNTEKSLRYEEQILAFVSQKGHIVRKEADVLLGVSQATSNRILKRMVAEGLLYQVGSD